MDTRLCAEMLYVKFMKESLDNIQNILQINMEIHREIKKTFLS